MDFDAVSHDGPTHRFLVRELKREGEALTPAARRALMDVALTAQWTVWYVQLREDGEIAWADMLAPDSIDVLSRDEYRSRLRDWWEDTYSLANYTRWREPGEEG